MERIKETTGNVKSMSGIVHGITESIEKEHLTPHRRVREMPLDMVHGDLKQNWS